MGIKFLWNILDPYCERKPLHFLQGQKVGIDLSGWVCESQCVVDYFIQPKMYLRNLFFRTAYLLLMGISPVFIMDGEAPQLKHQVIAKRNEANQFMGARPRAEPSKDKSKKKADKGRTRFNYVLKQCRELLATMGVSCIQAEGEAEALCAYLNKDGLIDGIISQDSDCFGYGAVVVYRNFSVSKQGKSSAGNGAVDVYDMRRVKQNGLDLKQNKAVALALLCGCDYLPDGVEGVGREAVLKLFSLYSDDEILERLREWRDKAGKYTDLELKVDDKMFCSACGHLGHYIKHTKAGCGDCRMTKGCDGSVWKEKRLVIKAELNIRRRALTQSDFPSEHIITEFLHHPPMPKELPTSWSQPNLVKFIKSFSKHLQWTEIYCFQKILPLLTRWQLQELSVNSNARFPRGCIVPKLIRKKRVLKGTQSFEILWHDPDKYFDAIFPEEDVKAFELEHPEEGIAALWVTVEPSALVEKAYPDVVDEFLERKTKKKKKPPTEKAPRKRKKQNTSLHDMSGLLDALPKAEKRSRKKPEKGIQPITKFLSNINKANQSTPQTDKPASRQALKEVQHAIEIPSDFSDCSLEDESLGEIINSIISRRPDLNKIGDKTLHYEDDVGSTPASSTPTTSSLKSSTLTPFMPVSSTPTTTANKSKFLDDTFLRNLKRKSLKNLLKDSPKFALRDSFKHSLEERLHQSMQQHSFDDFYIDYNIQYDPIEGAQGELESQTAQDCETSYFFEPVIDESKHDFFEESLKQIIEPKESSSSSDDLFKSELQSGDYKENYIVLSD